MWSIKKHESRHYSHAGALPLPWEGNSPDPLETIPPGNTSQKPNKIFHFLKLIFSCSPSSSSTLSFWLTFFCSIYSLTAPHVVATATTHARRKSSHCHKPEAPKVSVCPRTSPSQPFSHTYKISFQRHQPTHAYAYKKHLTCRLSQASLSKPGCQQQCCSTVVYNSLESARTLDSAGSKARNRAKGESKKMLPCGCLKLS